MVVDERWCAETKGGAMVVFRDKGGERWCAETKGGAKVVFRDKGGERWCAETMVVFVGVRGTLLNLYILCTE